MRAGELALEVERERIARLEIQKQVQDQGEQVQQLMPRRLTEEQKAKLIQFLSKLPASILIARDSSAAEANIITTELGDIFASARSNVSKARVMGVPYPPPSGLGVRVVDKEKLTLVEISLIAALKDAEIPYDILLVRRVPWKRPGAGFPGLPAEVLPDAEILLSTRIQ